MTSRGNQCVLRRSNDFYTFSDTVGFAMSNDCGLDERLENLSGSKIPVLYGFDDLQT